jgi:hypothetical protein
MKIVSPYCGHWLYNPPRFTNRVFYPILIFEDGRAELIDVFSALTTTKHTEPGEKSTAMCIRNARMGLTKGDEPRDYFAKLAEGHIIPVTLSPAARRIIPKLNRRHLDGWEYDEIECPPCDALLEIELTPQLKGKLEADPMRIFSGG